MPGVNSLGDDEESEEQVSCFAAGTLIRMGLTRRFRRIENLRPGHVIADCDGGLHVVQKVTKSWTRSVVCIDAHRCGFNAPQQPIVVTANHLIRMPTEQILQAKRVGRVLPTPQYVYHILCENWTWLDVHGLRVETCAWKDDHHSSRPAPLK